MESEHLVTAQPVDLDAIEARWRTASSSRKDGPGLVAVLRELRGLALTNQDGRGIDLSAYGWRVLILRLTGGES